MPTRVRFWFDPVCPFAWTAACWIREVERLRGIECEFRLMSLAVLNEDRDSHPPEADRGLDSAWRPVRVAAALAARRGDPDLFGEVPRRRAALDVFDGTVLLAGHPGFSELRRSRP